MNIRWTPALLKEILEKTRNDTSLGILTKKFVDVLRKAPDGSIDLNRAVEKMAVQKRRIYDIVNILEGIGLVEKTARNNIRWRCRSPEIHDEDDSKLLGLQADIAYLDEKESSLDKLIEITKADLNYSTKDPEAVNYAYVTQNDIEGINSFGDQTVISIRAPPGTTLEVPFPKEKIQLWLKSGHDPVQFNWMRQNVKSSARIVSSRDISSDQDTYLHERLMDQLTSTGLQQVDAVGHNGDVTYPWPAVHHGINTTTMASYPCDYGYDVLAAPNQFDNNPNLQFEGIFRNNIISPMASQLVPPEQLPDLNLNDSSLSTLQTCQPFDHLIIDPMTSPPFLQQAPHPSTTNEQHNGYYMSMQQENFPQFDEIPFHLWHTFPPPIQQNSPVLVPKPLDPVYSRNDLTTEKKQGIPSLLHDIDEDILSPLSPLMTDDDIHYLALREGLADLF